MVETSRSLSLFREMLRIRMVEEAIADRYAEQEMRCPVHLCIGQEAIPAGVCAQLNTEDQVFGNHRSHGHYLAKGGGLKAMVAEMYGKATGCSRGKGGSMHLIDLSVQFMGSTPIVGSIIPIAVGAAFSAWLKKESRVVVVFFGRAATEEGVFAESLNFASLKKLPVVFVSEDNFFSVYTPLQDRQPAGRNNLDLARSLGIPADGGDGNDVEFVFEKTGAAVRHAREGKGPSFLEFQTYRWREHCGPFFDNQLGYRPEAEYEEWVKRCPVGTYERRLIHEGRLPAADAGRMREDIQNEIQAAFQFAKDSPFPEIDQMGAHIYADDAAGPPGKVPRMTREITFSQALHEAADHCLAEDPSVYVLGLGVPDPKGVFGTTAGLQEKYGPDRVMDMPVSENAMTGVAIGSAMTGMRPIMTHQRIDFMLLSLDQVINNAAKWHYMFGGQLKAPLVIRLLVGRGWGQGPQHSQSLQALFAHIPGLKVVCPFSPHDAKGLLIAAVRDPNPVIFIEHRWLHGLYGPVPEGEFTVPIGEARLAREGNDITLVASSYMTREALQAADILALHAVSAEVVDLRSLRPLDENRILASVRKTGRLLTIDGGWRSFGVAAEINALAAERAFDHLKQPPRRVTFPDSPTPTSWPLANRFYPRAVDMAATALSMLGQPPLDRSQWDAGTGAPLDVPDKSFTGPF